MTTPAHIKPADHRDKLADAALRLLTQQLPEQSIAFVWPEAQHIRIRTTDGRTGDVEALVNWDAAPAESAADGSEVR